MFRFIAWRLAGVLLSLWAAVTLVFFAANIIPGDPAEAALAQSTASADVLEQRREALGLNDPLGVRYLRYIGGLVTGDLGVSWSLGQGVGELIAGQFAPTLALAFAGLAIAILAGGLLGLGATLGQGGWLGELSRGAVGLLLSVPVMVSGTLLIWVFSVLLGALPATGQGSAAQLVLPALAVGLNTSAGIARTVEAGVRAVSQESFLLLARAKGLRRWQVLTRHALRVGLLPTLDLIALQFGFLLGGTVVTEIVFARQGLGRLLLFAVLDQDLPVVQGIVVLAAAVYGVLNLAADIAKAWLDPRLRDEVA